jgi:hypothetical protein
VLGFFQQRFQFGVPAAQTFLQQPRAARDVDEPLGVGRYGDDGGSCVGRTDCGDRDTVVGACRIAGVRWGWQQVRGQIAGQVW